jgi:hypothetical protein
VGNEITITPADGFDFMTFEPLTALGIRHGFAVRQPGMNVVEDRVYQKLAGRAKLATARQTHSTTVQVIDDAFDSFYPQEVAADALLSGRAGVTIAIHVADCVPVFIAHRGGRAVGLVHAGWRGTAEGFALKAARRFIEYFKLDPSEVTAGVGPAIESACYPVGPEVAERFNNDVKRRGDGDAWLLDLKQESFNQLQWAGLEARSISVSGLCTRCRPDLLHSYRREGEALAGQMIAFMEASHG